MFGPPGTAYVYVCYGIHQMLNLVTGPEGSGQAVLVRACEVVHGLDFVSKRRGGRSGPVLLTGPGKVGAALAMDTSFCGHLLVEPGGLEALLGSPATQLSSGPRIGIDYAEPEHRDAPWRIADAQSRWVSHRSRLTPGVTP